MLAVTAKYKKTTLVIIILLLLLMLPGLFKLNVNNDIMQFIDKSSSSYKKLVEIENEFGSTNVLYLLLVNNKDDILTPSSLKLIRMIS